MGTQFEKRRYVIIQDPDMGEALRYAQPFDEAGIDVHMRYLTNNKWEVAIYLAPGTPLATVRGGIVQDIENIPPGIDVIVADYDSESTDPVSVGIFNFVDEAMRAGPTPGSEK